ncbi:MAG: DUF839 domain-containing protein [Candidatus Eisenbacteria bacterium]|nr:DUF839 domain-containing protein [Candidatus Eisenbacteria bacterium]
MKGRSTIALGSLWVVAASATAFAADPYEHAPAYAKAVAGKTTLRPIVTTGQQFALTDGAEGETFRFVGIPDGMGLYKQFPEQPASNRLVLLVNHEFNQTQGGPAGPLPSGARQTELILSLNRRGAPRAELRPLVSGSYEIERVFVGEPPVEVNPITTGIARLCSAFLANANVGFDRNIFLAGEESEGSSTFDGQGGLCFGTIDGDAYALPRIGHAAWENVVAVPGTGAKTVIFGLEDGPSGGDGLHSQLYMYVGEKNPSGMDALSINGLNNGYLYTFVSNDPTRTGESTFMVEGSTVSGRWVEVDWTLNDSALDAATKAVGGFGFVRIEDGCSDLNTDGRFYFATTGRGGTSNPFGRLYQLDFDPKNPLADASLTLLVNSDVNRFISPDNIDITAHGELMICEDPNYNLSTLGLTRDTGLWAYNVNDASLTLVAELDRDAARTHALGVDPGNSSDPGSDVPGGWEFSGVIDAEEYLGRGAWLLNVQAHSLRIVPVPETVQGGQVLQLSYLPSGGASNGSGTGLIPGTDQRPAQQLPNNVVSLQANPNPFAATTTVQFSLAQAGQVEGAVYAADGSRVRQLASGEMAAGAHTLVWDGVTDRGTRAASGVYFVRIATGTETREARITLTK